MKLSHTDKLIDKYVTPRCRTLDRFEKYSKGTQYEGRKPFMVASEVPLLERAPCVVDPIVQNAIKTHAEFIFGEGHFPTITTFVTEDDSKFDPELGMSKEDSDVLDRFVLELVKQTNFRSSARSLFKSAESSGTAVAICSVRNGKFCVNSVSSKWCTPEFNNTGTLVALDICVPFKETFYNDQTGSYEDRAMLYRRRIDTNIDIIYNVEKCRDDGKQPPRTVDYSRTVAHYFDFCPVVWYKYLEDCPEVGEIDGHPIHETQLDEIDSLNFCASQWVRASFYAGDPQMYETGVPVDYNPSPGGRVAQIKDPEFEKAGYGMPSAKRGAGRKKGTGTVWTYPSPDTKVGMLSLPGDAMVSLEKRVKDLREKISEALGYVDATLTDLNHSTGNLSGRALHFVHSRLIAFCDEARTNVADHLLTPLFSMLLRIALVVERRNAGGLRIAGIDKVFPILEKFERNDVYEDGSSSSSWDIPPINYIWGKYFESTETDDQALITGVVQAYTAKIITLDMAVQKMSSIFPIQSVANIVAQLMLLQEEQKKEEQKAAQSAQSKLKTEAA